MNISKPEIIITPVANGWTVRMPSNDELEKITGGFSNIMEKFKDALTETNELEEILKRNNDKESKAKFPVDNSLHVFTDFTEVLSFLAEQITE